MQISLHIFVADGGGQGWPSVDAMDGHRGASGGIGGHRFKRCPPMPLERQRMKFHYFGVANQA